MIPAILTGVRLHMKQASRNPFDLSGVIVWPILYASIAYYLLDAKNEPRLLLSASLGAAVMLMWSMVVIASSGALEQQRWQGTLELVVAAPTPLTAVIGPICIAGALVGAYAIGATLIWGALLFDVPVRVEQPLAFAVAIPACALAIGMLGLIMAATFVLYRASFHLGIAMQYPVWIVSGLLVPISFLPSFVRPLSWVLAPTWGFRAIQEAALGGTPWPDIGMCLVLSLVYLAIGGSCLIAFEYIARARGSLRLT
ncbi:MAG: ABC transporter permease [Actinomycetota bacterium]